MAEKENIELYQFNFSTFNEKARWALDYKHVPHRKITLLPGPHMRTMKKLSGQTKTPAISFDGKIVAGSAAIFEELEKRFPEPPFYPSSAEEHKAALAIQTRFDEDFGPRIRRAIIGTLMEDADYFCKMFTSGMSLPVRALYRATFPLAKGLIRKGNGITGKDAIEDGNTALKDALDFVAENTQSSGFLIGGRFSFADITAAAHLAPVADPPGSTMERPKPLPKSFSAWLERWSDHPTRKWILGLYESHRPQTSELQ